MISVIVPAFNAANTIHETVSSALNQTHCNLEVIIVDDGSTDQTGTVAARLAESDLRVRYVYKENGGVASARNRGIAEAQGEFVATLDADDLWYPTKLERQLQRLEQSGPETALVYAWCCWIDDDGNVTGSAPPTRLEGNILPDMCLGNVVISGSNALTRREAVIAAGGFDESLRSRGAQGCEDWKLYLAIAERHRIAMVPEYLVGYRVSPGSMSDDFEQMMRSRRLVEAEFIAAHPELALQFARGETILARSLALRAMDRGQIRQAVKLLTNHPQGRAAAGLASLTWLMSGAIRRSLRWSRIHRYPTAHQFLPTSRPGQAPCIR
ncbi:glycosyltransferase family 2 protein [Bradyrhizobium liaoningense]|uniref:glycosyltransferase family 2 protein n=1 Tax=Bradyrhizobium liaoningense TaxID=43992 RepID=UPI001BAB4127|nr:glycosyltransferase family A protein [Bradyrhizobium liaoningense]MBR1170982.1 glycosyltransferase family 2 protein [Bradyrhizobium liaoningense]